ncbi:MAG: NfeD family protein [Bryobacterales bacterium]|nr:NfeD family protein [Bryobacterales bacterium]
MEVTMALGWWIWLVLGLLLIVGEALMPTDFFLMFFGVGALAAAVTTALGLTPGAISQSVVFVLVALVTLLTLRDRLRNLLHRNAPSRPVDSLVGEIGTAAGEIPASGLGKVMLRGSPWNARNAGPARIGKEERVRVEQLEGITLVVRALETPETTDRPV